MSLSLWDVNKGELFPISYGLNIYLRYLFFIFLDYFNKFSSKIFKFERYSKFFPIISTPSFVIEFLIFLKKFLFYIIYSHNIKHNDFNACNSLNDFVIFSIPSFSI